MGDLDFMTDEQLQAAADKAGDGDFTPLPVGWYSARITEAEVKLTKAGNGKMVYLRLDVEGPTHAGRVVFDRMVVAHPNPDAVEIGQGRFRHCHQAAGFPSKPSNVAELLGKVVAFKAKTERSKEYGDKTVPSSYKAQGTTAPANGADTGYGGANEFGGDEPPF